MPGSIFLEGPRVELRTIEEADLPFLRDALNAPAVRRHLFPRPPFNLEQEREYFDAVVAEDDEINLLITVDGEPVGPIGLWPADSITGSTEIGLFMAEAWWGEGYGTEAAELCTGYAFEERRFHRVIARVVAANRASRRVWEKLDYREEATFREAVFLERSYHDVVLYAILEDEWQAR
jgi:RimJ/RimL family protein N-acetyltransferase